jgi:serine protease
VTTSKDAPPGRLLASLLLLLAGCPLTIEPSEPAMGASCQGNTDCIVGICLTNYPGGYCTLPCKDQPCPAGSRCVVFNIFGFKDYSCRRTCEQHADCRRAGYYCAVPPDKGSRVCETGGPPPEP